MLSGELQSEAVGAKQIGGFDSQIERGAAQRDGLVAAIVRSQEMCLEGQQVDLRGHALLDGREPGERRQMAAHEHFDFTGAYVVIELVRLRRDASSAWINASA